MTNRTFIVTAALSLAILLVSLLVRLLLTDTTVTAAAASKDHQWVAPVVPAKKQVAVAKPKKPNTTIASPENVTPYHLDMQKRFAKAIRYPEFSQALSEGQDDLLHPLAFIAHQRPLDAAQSMSASLSLESYVIFKPSPIEIHLRIHANDGALLPNIAPQATILHRGEALISFPLSLIDDDNKDLLFSSNYSSAAARDWPQDLQIQVRFNAGLDTETVLSSDFQYTEPSARLIAVSEAEIDQEYLSIPLDLRVEEAGFYQISANLMTLNGKPIAHVYVKPKLKSGQQTAVLRVHGDLLRDQKQAGPYLLQNFSIRLLPAQPGQLTQYGLSDINQAPVRAFDLDLYANKPYINEDAQVRLRFLQALGSKNQ